MERKIIDIFDMDLSGRGIGRDSGKAVFVPGAVTGDRVECVTEVSKKRYDIARLTEVVEPSPARLMPECTGFGKCGGCVFMNITREAELDIKRRAVEASFRRAGVKGVSVGRILSGKDRGYRNKAVFHRGDDGKYGFFSAGSRECFGGGDCLLVPKLFNDIVRFIEGHDGGVAHSSIMLRIGGGDVMIAVQVRGFGDGASVLDAVTAAFPQVKSAYECVGYPTSVEAEFKLHSGTEHIVTEFCETKLRISPKSFFQVNGEVAGMLCREIADALSPEDGGLILDLYCGIGTIGLTLAKRFPGVHVLGAEINSSAVADARYNCTASGIDNAEFICADAGRTVFEEPPYAVVVDPPRYGLTDSMIKTVLRLKPEVLVYMSCDPGTLAGDSSKLLSGGYTIRECVAGDMFPECPHVEAVCIFDRS